VCCYKYMFKWCAKNAVVIKSDARAFSLKDNTCDNWRDCGAKLSLDNAAAAAFLAREKPAAAKACESRIAMSILCVFGSTRLRV
jgi:hypothetical protein